MKHIIFLIVLCFNLIAMGHVGMRRIVWIGEEPYLLKISFRTRIPSFPLNEEPPVEFAGIGHKTINDETDEHVEEYLKRLYAWYVANLQRDDHFDWEKHPQTFQRMVRTFMSSTYFLSLQKLTGPVSVEFKKKSDEFGDLEKIARLLGSLDGEAMGSRVSLIGIETPSLDDGLMTIEREMGIRLARDESVPMSHQSIFPELFVPELVGKPRWLGESVFIHSLFVDKTIEKLRLVPSMLFLALRHGILTTGRTVLEGQTAKVSENLSVPGPANFITTRHYSVCEGRARELLHNAFGFVASEDPAITSKLPDGLRLMVANQSLEINGKVPGADLIPTIKMGPLFLDLIYRANYPENSITATDISCVLGFHQLQPFHTPRTCQQSVLSPPLLREFKLP